MSLALRLKKRRIEMGFKSQRKLAAASSVAAQTIRLLESGERENSNSLKDIASTLNTTVDYLLTGRMSVSSYPNSEPDPLQKGVEPIGSISGFFRLIPIHDWDKNSLTRTENRIDDMTMSRKDNITTTDNCGENSRAFRIKDDSMVSLFPNTDSFRLGDTIIVDPDKKYGKLSFVIAEIEDKPEFVFRQVIDIAGELFLNSLNPAYPKIKMDEKVKIFGTLIRSYREHI